MKATQSTDETWLPVVGYEGFYEVSNLGRVRGLPRLDLKGRRLQGKELHHGLSGNPGYPHVNLTRDGAKKTKRVHVLVAEAFLGPKPPGRFIEVCHNDNDRLNPQASNLRWGTRSENAIQCVEDGRNYWRNQTHCPNGHEYTPENTRWYTSYRSGRPTRGCLTCKRRAGRLTAAKSRRLKRAAA